jgi:hypothetical protein
MNISFLCRLNFFTCPFDVDTDLECYPSPTTIFSLLCRLNFFTCPFDVDTECHPSPITIFSLLCRLNFLACPVRRCQTRTTLNDFLVDELFRNKRLLNHKWTVYHFRRHISAHPLSSLTVDCTAGRVSRDNPVPPLFQLFVPLLYHFHPTSYFRTTGVSSPSWVGGTSSTHDNRHRASSLFVDGVLGEQLEHYSKATSAFPSSSSSFDTGGWTPWVSFPVHDISSSNSGISRRSAASLCARFEMCLLSGSRTAVT